MPISRWLSPALARERLNSEGSAASPDEDRLLELIREQADALRHQPDQSLREAMRAPKLLEEDGNAPGPVTLLAFAAVVEAARRTLGHDVRPVQIRAALALHRGDFVELANGEGKTLAAVLPVALHAMHGRGVHVLTTQDHLARRDAEWMGPIYERLGLSVGRVCSGDTRDQRRQAYQCSVTYAPVDEVVFDALRDAHTVGGVAERVQRPLSMAVLDEADAVLIDESRIPFTLARGRLQRQDLIERACQAVLLLEPGRDYEFDGTCQTAFFTEAGFLALESELSCSNLHLSESASELVALENALQARAVLRADVHYVIEGEEIVLIDPFTGRVARSRRFPDGLHSAVEQFHDLPVSAQGRPVAAITVRDWLSRYPRFAGLSGTLRFDAEELRDLLAANTVMLPSHCSSARIDEADRIFATRAARDLYALGEIERIHDSGAPVLVGTASVDESNRISEALAKRAIACEVLNATNESSAPSVFARAGDLGRVTITTNLAGRGVDIRLGGPERHNHEAVCAVGGLHVVGLGRHLSCRADAQLRGRAGRQGEPGSSCFFVSLEDDLFSRFGFEGRIPDRLKRNDGPIVHRRAADEVERALRVVESRHSVRRRDLQWYANVIDDQRMIFLDQRNTLLEADLPDLALRLAHVDALWADHIEQLAALRASMRFAQSSRGLQRPPLANFLEGASALFVRLNGLVSDLVSGSVGPDEDAADSSNEVSTLRIDEDPAGLPRPRLRRD